MKDIINQFCADIGKDPMMVQGAGGNVSWKDGNTLMIKASGAWLADAEEKTIFLPVDLAHLKAGLSQGDYSIAPRIKTNTLARASIETLFHALMPHQIVVHLHAIDILAHLVLANADHVLKQLIGDLASWVIIDYYKPGPELAMAVHKALLNKPDTNILFLKNHGIIIGANHINQIQDTLNVLSHRLTCFTQNIIHVFPKNVLDQIDEYYFDSDPEVHQLAINPELFSRLDSDWALYPDHVVFLGAKAYTYENFEAYHKNKYQQYLSADLIFIRGAGVYTKPSFTKAQSAQLKAYYHVLIRIKQNETIARLSNQNICELINWDAEHYRIAKCIN